MSRARSFTSSWTESSSTSPFATCSKVTLKQFNVQDHKRCCLMILCFCQAGCRPTASGTMAQQELAEMLSLLPGCVINLLQASRYLFCPGGEQRCCPAIKTTFFVQLESGLEGVIGEAVCAGMGSCGSISSSHCPHRSRSPHQGVKSTWTQLEFVIASLAFHMASRMPNANPSCCSSTGFGLDRSASNCQEYATKQMLCKWSANCKRCLQATHFLNCSVSCTVIHLKLHGIALGWLSSRVADLSYWWLWSLGRRTSPQEEIVLGATALKAHRGPAQWTLSLLGGLLHV